MTRCLWTGAEFPPVVRGGIEKTFASDAARAEAHKAARLYTEFLIARGDLTWAELRRWYDRRETAPRPRPMVQQPLPIFEGD